MAACTLLMVAVGALTFVLFPRNPKWEVQTIKVDPAEVTKVISAFTDPAFNSTVDFVTASDVHIDNSNFVGEVTGEPMEIKGCHEGMAVAQARCVITPELSKLLMSAVMPSFKLSLEVSGEVPVTVPALLGLKATAQINCTVDVNVLGIVQDPNKMVIG